MPGNTGLANTIFCIAVAGLPTFCATWLMLLVPLSACSNFSFKRFAFTSLITNGSICFFSCASGKIPFSFTSLNLATTNLSPISKT